MANPSGQNTLFIPQPQQGDVGVQQALAKEAPISGAPATPATPAAASPARAPAPPQRAMPGFPAIMPAPKPSAHYYRALADQWTRIAKLKGSSPLIRDIARKAEQYAAKVESGEV